MVHVYIYLETENRKKPELGSYVSKCIQSLQGVGRKGQQWLSAK